MVDISDNSRLDSGRPPAGARFPYGVPGENNNPRTVAIEDLVPFTVGYRGQWSTTTTYQLGDIVEWDVGRYFINASADNLNNEPNFQNRVYWVAISSSYWGNWIATIQYNRGEFVSRNNKFYVAKGDLRNEDPVTNDGTDWFELIEDVPSKASQSEVDTGTDNDKYVTPQTLAAHLRTLASTPHSEHPIIGATDSGMFSVRLPDIPTVQVVATQNRQWVDVGTVEIPDAAQLDINTDHSSLAYKIIVQNTAHRAIPFRLRLQYLDAADAQLGNVDWVFASASSTVNVGAQGTQELNRIAARGRPIPDNTAKLRWSIYTDEPGATDQTDLPSQTFTLNVTTTNIYVRASLLVDMHWIPSAKRLTLESSEGSDFGVALPINYRGSWDSQVEYQVGDIVHRTDRFFIANAVNTNTQPTSDNTDTWRQIDNIFHGDWASNIAYYKGDITARGGNYYLATADSSNEDPFTDTDNSHWISITGGGATSGQTARQVSAAISTALDEEQPPTPWDFVPLVYEANRLDSNGIHQGETTQLELVFDSSATTNSATGVTHATGTFQFPNLSNAVDSDASVVVKFPLRTSYVRTRTRVYLNAYDPLQPNVVLDEDSFELRDVSIGNNSAEDTDTIIPTLETRVKLRSNRLYRVVVRGNPTSSTQTPSEHEYAINYGDNSERFGIWIRLYQPEEERVIHEVYDAANAPNYRVGQELWYEGDLYRVEHASPRNTPNVSERTVPAHNATKTIELYPGFNSSRGEIGLSVVGNAADHFGRTTGSLGLGLTTYDISAIKTSNPAQWFEVEFAQNNVPAASLRTIEAPSGTTLNFSAAQRTNAHGRTRYLFSPSTELFAEDRHYSLDLGYIEPEVTVTEWSKVHDINRIPAFTNDDVGNLLIVGNDRQVTSEPASDALGEGSNYGWVQVFQATNDDPNQPGTILTFTRSVHNAKQIWVECAQERLSTIGGGDIGTMLIFPPFLDVADRQASTPTNGEPQNFFKRMPFGAFIEYVFLNESTVPASLGQVLGIQITAMNTNIYIRRVFARY